MTRKGFRLGIITKIFGRPALTQVFLSYWAALQVEGVRFVRVAAVSPDEDPSLKGLCFRGWKRVAAPNAPLCDKGNAAAQALRGRVDGVLNLGSDDFAAPEYVAHVAQRLQAGEDALFPSEIYYLEPAIGGGQATARCVHAYNLTGIGAGRALSCRALEAVAWQPWQAGGHSPDRGMMVRLQRAGVPITYLPEGHAALLDVKTGTNIQDFEAVAKGKYRRAAIATEVLEQFPGLKELLAGSLAAWEG